MKEKEIYFILGGIECNNIIIRGIISLNKKRKNYIIFINIEYFFVLNILKDLEEDGFEVIYLEVGKDGKINIEDLKNVIKLIICLVSMMYVNNEIGII